MNIASQFNEDTFEWPEATDAELDALLFGADMAPLATPDIRWRHRRAATVLRSLFPSTRRVQ